MRDKPIEHMSIGELVDYFSEMTPEELHKFYISPKFDEKFYRTQYSVVMTFISHLLARLCCQHAAKRKTEEPQV